MVSVVVGFLGRALEAKTYNLADIPKGVLASAIGFFDKALKTVCLQGVLYNDTSRICTQIFTLNHSAFVEERMVYDLMRYRSFFAEVASPNHQVPDNMIPHLRELFSFFMTFKGLVDSDDSHLSRDDDDE